MRVLGVDPGLTACGLALCDSGTWTTKTVRTSAQDPLADRALHISQVAASFCGGAVNLLVLEDMEVYEADVARAAPRIAAKKANDLLKLCLVEGAVLGRVPHAHRILVHPKVWKKQVPKNIHHNRIRQQLPALGPCSKDAMDAVGLALYGMKKINAQVR